MPQISDELLERIIQTVASNLHDIWRKARNYEPRIKNVVDGDWISTHKTTTCDIANTSHENLPQEWKIENEASAKAAIEIVASCLAAGCEHIDNIEEEAASAEIHARWLERNSAQAEPLQLLSYFHVDFPEYERERDRVIWRETVRVWKEMVK